MNVLGLLNLSDIGSTVIHDDKMITVCLFFIGIRKRFPDYWQEIHVILDGVDYYRTQLIKD